MLIVVSGLPGTGKTTIARKLANELAAVYLRIDSIEQSIRNAGKPVQPHWPFARERRDGPADNDRASVPHKTRWRSGYWMQTEEGLRRIAGPCFGRAGIRSLSDTEQ
jgi:AAA domain